MVAMVCGNRLGVRIAIPQMKCACSVDPGGKAESFSTEWGFAQTVVQTNTQLLTPILSTKRVQ